MTFILKILKKITLKRMIFLKRVHYLTQVASENDSFPEKDILIGAEEFIGLEWGYDNEKNDNEEYENNFYNFGGNNHSDTENTGEI
jgi:hypothetical protein